MVRVYTVKAPAPGGGGLLNFRGSRAGLLERGAYLKKLEDGLVVSGTYTALFQSQGLLETLKTELDKKLSTPNNMQLIRNWQYLLR